MKLLIVESPGKVAKIQGFLGNDFKVMASYGHVRDLPEKGDIGVEAPDFVPRYVPIGKGGKELASLGEAAKKAEAVYLATDPDREGEGIAWHLMDALKLKNPYRVTYTEITETAVKKAVATPRQIDMNLVRAQEGRRVLDRLVGWKVSGRVSKVLGQTGLSAGRVQSPALRLVVDRETAIKNFRMTTHFGAEFVFGARENITHGWKAQWDSANFREDGQEYFLDKAVAEKIAALTSFSVTAYAESESRQGPPAPFTTASLQQAASNALKFNPQKTMDVAQKLYEAGHITYMRTDSPNLSEEAIADIRSLASHKDWPVPPKPRTWKSEAGAQEAHEAVRPTHFEVEEAGGDADEAALYKLIRLRALASQLCEAVYAVTKAALETDFEGRKVLLLATGRRLVEPGWRVVLESDQAEEAEDEPEAANPVPALSEGQPLEAASGAVQTKKTKAPARFTEASLIGELKRRGIGRPSTYAPTIEGIVSREYVKTEKRQLVPTETGSRIIAATSPHFSFLDYDFTKSMEERLDMIAEGTGDYAAMMRDSDELLDNEVEAFLTATSPKCPDCGKRLVHRVRKETKEAKGYNFWSCFGYPECKASFENAGGKPGERQANKAVLSEHKCQECGKPLVHRVKEGEGGYNFWGCSGYKEGCTAKYSDADGLPGEKIEKKSAPPSEYKCPKCKKPLYRRQGTSRKTGKEYDFYGCADRACNAIYYPKDDGTPDFNPKKRGAKK